MDLVQGLGVEVPVGPVSLGSDLRSGLSEGDCPGGSPNWVFCRRVPTGIREIDRYSWWSDFNRIYPSLHGDAQEGRADREVGWTGSPQNTAMTKPRWRLAWPGFFLFRFAGLCCDELGHSAWRGDLGMTQTADKPATYEDLMAVPDHFVAEIVSGRLHATPRPGPRHAMAASSLTDELVSPFGKGRGGPGGWWILDEPELHLGPHAVLSARKGRVHTGNPPASDIFPVAPVSESSPCRCSCSRGRSGCAAQ